MRAAKPLPSRPSRLLLSVAAAPVVTATLLAAGYAAADWAGRAPLAYPAPRNVAEAAGMAMDAELLRMLRDGQDPTAPLPVGPHVISPEFAYVTALEAAAWSRRAQTVQLLEREGFIAAGETRRHVACIATGIGATEIVEYLFPDGFTGCDPAGAIAALQARTR